MRRQLITLVAVCLVLLGGSWRSAAGSSGNSSNEPAWTNPSAQTLRLVGLASDVPEQPNFQNNIDCTELTYRLTTSSTVQAGCFMPAAYGLVDPDSDLVVFNGTDEALPLLPYTAHQVLTPWPNTVDTLALTTASTGGSYLALYKNLPAVLHDERNLAGQLVAKQVTAPPDLTLADPKGQLLLINAQTLAFSDDGDWLVAETLGGSFVRVNLATLAVVPFAPAFGAQGSPALLKSQVAISGNGRYVAIENSIAGSLKLYDLASCGSSPVINLQPLHCTVYDYWPFISSQLSGLNNFSHLRFVNDRLLSFTVTVGNVANQYELAPAAGITALTDSLPLT